MASKNENKEIFQIHHDLLKYSEKIHPILEKFRIGHVRARMEVNFFRTRDNNYIFYRRWSAPENVKKGVINVEELEDITQSKTKEERSKDRSKFKSKSRSKLKAIKKQDKIKEKIQDILRKISITEKNEGDKKKIVICLHGLHSHGEKFVILADYFAEKGWITYAPDLRGHGLSWTRSEEKGDIEDYNIWLVEIYEFIFYLMEKYKDYKFYIIAESMGAALSIKLVNTLRKNGHNISGLILLSPALKAWQELEISMFSEAFLFALITKPDKNLIPHKGKGKLGTNSIEYQQYQLTDPLRIPQVSPRYYYQVIKMVHSLKKEKLDKFVPTMVFYGDKDYLIKFKGIRNFIKDLATIDKALHYIPDAYHDILTDEEAIRYGLYKKCVVWIERN
ncbi:MAG: alpha/beta fold hydrolase [Promethearchaeota archaeon]